MGLTGKIQFRKGWLGGMILLVEEEVKPLFRRTVRLRWRRATLMDLAEPELRILVDMRSRPHVGACTLLPPLPAWAASDRPSWSARPESGSTREWNPRSAHSLRDLVIRIEPRGVPSGGDFVAKLKPTPFVVV